MAVIWDMHWPLTEGLGERLNNVGTLGPTANLWHRNCDWVVDGDRGLCLEFNGLSSIADTFSRIISDPNTFTASAWVKLNALPATSGDLSIIFCFYNVAYALSVKNDGVLQYREGTTTVESTTELSDDTWYHVAVVRRANDIELYVNGASETTRTIASLSNGAVAIVLGQTGKNIHPFNGRMQNVRYSTGSADDNDIAALYAAESSAVIPSTALPPNVPERNTVTLAFDETTGAWAKWDVGFDFLSGYRNSKYEYAILGARQGYVHELAVGHNDGASVNEGYATLAGTVTAGGVTDITDSVATFQTLGDGLAGCRIFGRVTGGDWQERIIIGNYATKLYVDRPFSPTVNEYVIAPIAWHWESRWMDLGDPAVRKRIYYLQAWVKETNADNDITVKYKTEYDEDWNETALGTDDEFQKISTATRGRKIKLRFEQ